MFFNERYIVEPEPIEELRHLQPEVLESLVCPLDQGIFLSNPPSGPLP